jgi:hypothetical protein
MYIQKLHELKQRVLRARMQTNITLNPPKKDGRILWLNFNIRSPTSGHPHSWQTHDILWDLEERAGRIMKSAGAEMIELQCLNAKMSSRARDLQCPKS